MNDDTYEIDGCCEDCRYHQSVQPGHTYCRYTKAFAMAEQERRVVSIDFDGTWTATVAKPRTFTHAQLVSFRLRDDMRRRSDAPDAELGVGPEPTAEEATERRAAYQRLRAHAEGPLRRKAERATTPRKIQRLGKAIRRVDSWAGLVLLFAVLLIGCGGAEGSARRGIRTKATVLEAEVVVCVTCPGIGDPCPTGCRP